MASNSENDIVRCRIGHWLFLSSAAVNSSVGMIYCFTARGRVCVSPYQAQTRLASLSRWRSARVGSKNS